jgi:hypothetical protein
VTILANDPARRTNAQALAELAELGWLTDTDEVLDLTIGSNAGFWKRYRPPCLVTNDHDVSIDADLHLDGTRTGLPDDWCDVAAWDPPYGYRGTSTFTTDGQYGIATYSSSKAIDDRLAAGAAEAVRISRRLTLVKCQDSNVASAFHDQTAIATRALTDAGADVIGKLHVNGGRAQPAGKSQLNPWGYWSTLLIARKR